MADNAVLFDVSPTDDQGKSKKKARARDLARPPIPETSSEDDPRVYRRKPGPIRPIGRIDDTYECIDPRCGTTCHDILLEEAGQWFLGCCFCNCTQWLPAIPGHLEPKGEQFTLRDGRFAGLTLDEVAVEPRGIDYIKWAAASHQRPVVKATCKTWLDHRNLAR